MMGVKYRVDFRNHDNDMCRVDISKEDYQGSIIAVKGQQGNACLVSYNASSDPFSPIVNSKASINITNEGQIDVYEMQSAGDRDFRVNVFIGDLTNPYWQGFLIPDGIESSFRSAPYELDVVATDGLMILEGIDFEYVKPDGAAAPTIEKIIDSIFSNLHLGLPLPVEWRIDMKSINHNNITVDYWIRQVVEEFYTAYSDKGNKEKRKCKWLLEGIVKAASARIYQIDGRWIIEQVLENDLKSTFTIGRSGYALINDDAAVTVDRGLKGVDVDYSYSKNVNALTNGSFDKINKTRNLPLHWNIRLDHSPETKSSFFGYKSRGDNGVHVDGDMMTSEKFNIDAFTVFKSLSIKFDYAPVSGFPTDDKGHLTNQLNPMFRLGVSYVMKGGKYWDSVTNSWAYLTETWYELTKFGYFKETEIGTVRSIPFTLRDIVKEGKQIKLGDVIQVSFDKFGETLLPNPANIDKSIDIAESYMRVYIYPSSVVGHVSMYGNFDITTGDAKDTYSISKSDSKYTEIEKVDLAISTSFNSFINSDIKGDYQSTNKTYKFDVFDKKMSLSESVGYQTMRLRQEPCMIFSGSIRITENLRTWQYGQMYRIDGLENKKFMPLSMSYNIEKCSIKAELYEFRNIEVSNLEIKHIGGDELKEGSAVTSWGNDPKFGVFYSNWINSNCQGSSPYIQYGVAANKYTSTISKKHANQLAQNDIDQNGQAYANNIRVCPNV